MDHLGALAEALAVHGIEPLELRGGTPTKDLKPGVAKIAAAPPGEGLAVCGAPRTSVRDSTPPRWTR
ncbi:MAG: hypothetical protein LBD97_09380 [Bifidobacteriaceae bacterium]|nr:hypothetical protein [Bifidobacteriaceae bacterium]